MEFKESLKALADRAAKTKDNIRTEEATKTSLILPFIQALGYDIFNPMEVIPECDCDYGTKKREKIDYTICIDGEPKMLVECKHWEVDIERAKAQLFRYFHVSPAKFGILTNGIEYQFFTDLKEQNKMDEMPFFVINIFDLKESHIEKLKQFRRESYNTDQILSSATEMKYTNALRAELGKEATAPTDDFIRYFTKKVYQSPVTKSVLDEFRPLLIRAFAQYTNDVVNDRLKQAITPDIPSVDGKPAESPETIEKNKDLNIVTTENELLGFNIVRAILCEVADPERVFYRDAQTYFAILFDNNNRKPICRLHFNRAQKYIETFDENKQGTKHPIESLPEIYRFANELREVVKFYQTMD